MELPNWFNQAKNLGFAALAQASGVVGAGVGYAREAIGGAWLLGSTETSSSYDHERVDEKHYFLMPDRRADEGYSLYVMRCLPEGAPPINDLPKRRLFHLPNDHAMPTLEHLLLSDARAVVATAPREELGMGDRLNDIADQIDQLDGKVFNGLLLIGGLVALVNPLAGAAVAAKALIPSIGMLLSKHGLKYVGEAANSHDLSSRIRSAEKEVRRQFSDAGTSSLVNPLLAQLSRALDTSESEFDPILEFDADALSFGQEDRGRLFKLTCQAITNTYEQVLGDAAEWEAACLGPEDIRYLKLIRDLAGG